MIKNLNIYHKLTIIISLMIFISGIVLANLFPADSGTWYEETNITLMFLVWFADLIITLLFFILCTIVQELRNLQK